MIFVDTSAIFAILDAKDESHSAARDRWVELLESDQFLVTTNYIVLETCALAQNRLGMAAVRAIQDDVVPVLEVQWVDQETHSLAMAALLAAGRRKLSLVDCSSFVMMRRQGIRNAFAFDKHFVEEGFRCTR